MSMRQLRISQSITTREAPSLQKYLQEISKVSMLSPAEEAVVTAKVKQGDKAALDQLTKANLRFVVSVAKQYQGQGLSLPDLINEGNLGLIKAAEKFDHTRGFKFISFAVWWIRQSILMALAGNARLVRLPLNKVVLNNRVRRTEGMLEQQLERQPSPNELAEALGMSVEDLDESIKQSNRTVSLDASNDDEESCLLDLIENQNSPKADAELAMESLHTEIKRSLQGLTLRQRETICFFFGIGIERPLSLEDIAIKFVLTPERVRQIKDKALLTLRKKSNMDNLRSYLGG